jgi:serine/threonine-protein kinase/endoribonuclease IRE1
VFSQRHHYQDLPESVRRSLGELPDGFLGYFARRFPRLLLHVHRVVSTHVANEAMFDGYFRLMDD